MNDSDAFYFVNEFISLMKIHANPERAKSMKAYMKNQSEYLGISSPERRVLSKPFLAIAPKDYEEGITIFQTLWLNDFREIQYFAMEWAHKHRMWQEKSFHELIEWAIIQRPWWDTVDFIAPNWAGKYFRQFPELKEPVLMKWISSNHLWLNRAAMIFQLQYKEQTDTMWLEKAIIPHLDSKEFFHKKAAGWALRQYAKTNPTFTLLFVEKNKCSNLTRREALKHL